MLVSIISDAMRVDQSLDEREDEYKVLKSNHWSTMKRVAKRRNKRTEDSSPELRQKRSFSTVQTPPRINRLPPIVWKIEGVVTNSKTRRKRLSKNDFIKEAHGDSYPHLSCYHGCDRDSPGTWSPQKIFFHKDDISEVGVKESDLPASGGVLTIPQVYHCNEHEPSLEECKINPPIIKWTPRKLLFHLDGKSEAGFRESDYPGSVGLFPSLRGDELKINCMSTLGQCGRETMNV